MSEQYEGTLRWFGKAFDAPMYEGMPEVPTPVGSDCLGCGEPIEEGDPGITMPYVHDATTVTQEPMHIECHLRSVIGSPAHLSGQCSCHGGTDERNGKTYRQQAQESVAMFWGEDWKTRPVRPLAGVYRLGGVPDDTDHDDRGNPL